MNYSHHGYPEVVDSLDSLKIFFGKEYLNYQTIKRNELYKIFTIPKKTGGHRVISKPHNDLMSIQLKIKSLLESLYRKNPAAHGFITGRSIVTNAKLHQGKYYVLNIDLKDFFPTITLKRIRGLLISKPYNLSQDIAAEIAQLCCWNYRLPQGSPTSPILSNMICAGLDSQLYNLAKINKCHYTRYADDITFSTTRSKFPKGVAINDINRDMLILSNDLVKIINSNGFNINSKKVRIQHKSSRQEVTGLTVNRFPNVQRKYVRNIRAILHAWEKYGYKKAHEEYFRKYKQSARHPSKGTQYFVQIVNGKLQFLKMVRGSENKIYLNLKNKYDELCSRDKIFQFIEPVN